MNERHSTSQLDPADAASLRTYEQLPYPRLFYADTHPDMLATVATLFGMTPASPSKCRVLELGSATGANIIPLAEHLSGSTFVGIERSPRQVEIGRARIAELGLANIELLQKDLMDVTSELGAFDYIIAHGVYSWVPDCVQRKVLDICRDNLAPQGVAYISYNTYPGWKMREMLRDAVLHRTDHAADPRERVAEARKILRVIQNGLGSRSDPYAAYMRTEIASVDKSEDAYIAHEYLEDFNSPCYFREFAERAKEAKLQFISEVDVASALREDLPPEARGSLNELGASIEREQCRDFVRNTRFRKSLLCHDGVKLETKFSSQRFRSFYFTTPLFPSAPVNPLSGDETTFGYGQTTIKTTAGFVKAAVGTLAQSAPQRLAFDDLVNATVQRLGAPENVSVQQAAQNLENMLLEMFIDGLVYLYTRPIDYADTAGERPVARPIARLTARNGETVPNFLNEAVPLEQHDRRLIELMDGTRDQTALGELYRQILAELNVQPMEPGDPLQHELVRLARASLLSR